MKNIIMPKLSDTMTEGLLGAWLKGIGDTVARGDIIAEVETDKATMGLEAFDDGILLEQRVQAGETVAVGTVLGTIGSRDERPAVNMAESTAVPEEKKAVEQAADAGTVRETPVPAPAAASTLVEKASPVVRRRARELGIALETVPGSGFGGRVLLEDLEKFARSQPEPEEPAITGTPPDAPAATGSEPESQPLSRMRRAIARTVSASWRDIPHFSVTVEIRMDNAIEVRRELKKGGTNVSVNDMVMKGVAVSLQKCPQVNATFIDGSIVLHSEVNLGLMVKVDNGLLVPVISGCQTLPLAELAAKSRQLIERARSGGLTEAEMADGTFSISNLGSYGVSQFSAIILPPQVAILAVGAVIERLVPGKGGPVTAMMMKATLSADHRVLDGVAAAEFLGELKQNLESPVRLLF